MWIASLVYAQLERDFHNTPNTIWLYTMDLYMYTQFASQQVGEISLHIHRSSYISQWQLTSGAGCPESMAIKQKKDSRVLLCLWGRGEMESEREEREGREKESERERREREREKEY